MKLKQASKPSMSNQDLPNLAGVATKDLVETIGSGSFQASYINWARTMNLLHQHAPGWMVSYQPTPDGALCHRAPGVGGYLLINFAHVDGRVTPPLPQAVMDYKNNPIPFEKISARDITDTQRRGMCMAAAMTFGLGYELWAKMPLESGYAASDEQEAPKPAPAARKAAQGTTGGTSSQVTAEQPSSVTREAFMEACLEKGLNTKAIDFLLGKIGDNYAGGISTLESKPQSWVDETNGQFGDATTAANGKKNTSSKNNPEDY
jgi:hypothetical protein